MRARRPALGVSLLASGLALACAPASLELGEDRPGGAATVTSTLPREVDGLTDAQHATFVVGGSFEQHDWVTAPASTTSRDGLGPLYNATRCSACHVNGGRGQPADEGAEMLSALVRLGVPSADGAGALLPEPTYGTQLSPRAILGVSPEAATRTRWIETLGTFADGAAYSLRAPEIEIGALAYGPLAEGTQFSVRIAQPLIGLGLLEAIAEEDVLANADPDDVDHDGVSGRASRVWDGSAWRLGRFGWKASAPDVRAQTAAALAGDIGITSSLAPDESCTISQTACMEAPRGDGLQASDAILDAITFYQRALGVPARRDASEPTVLRGRALFHEAGCATCHVPSFTTGASDIDAVAGQRIWPYTDLLLHDMGESLADGSGAEWRTPPLWGVGLAETASFLHDGRARDVAEAILWHGGEADAARVSFRAMSAADRDALVRFVRSL